MCVTYTAFTRFDDVHLMAHVSLPDYDVSRQERDRSQLQDEVTQQ